MIPKKTPAIFFTNYDFLYKIYPLLPCFRNRNTYNINLPSYSTKFLSPKWLNQRYMKPLQPSQWEKNFNGKWIKKVTRLIDFNGKCLFGKRYRKQAIQASSRKFYASSSWISAIRALSDHSCFRKTALTDEARKKSKVKLVEIFWVRIMKNAFCHWTNFAVRVFKKW